MATTPSTDSHRADAPSRHVGVILFPSIALDNAAVRQALAMDIPVTAADIANGSRVEARLRFALAPFIDTPGITMAVTTDASNSARFANTEIALAEQGFAFDLDGATPESGTFYLYWRPTMAVYTPLARPVADTDAIVAIKHYAQPRMRSGAAPVADSMEMN